jgi:hypothetical protein
MSETKKCAFGVEMYDEARELMSAMSETKILKSNPCFYCDFSYGHDVTCPTIPRTQSLKEKATEVLLYTLIAIVHPYVLFVLWILSIWAWEKGWIL